MTRIEIVNSALDKELPGVEDRRTLDGMIVEEHVQGGSNLLSKIMVNMLIALTHSEHYRVKIVGMLFDLDETNLAIESGRLRRRQSETASIKSKKLNDDDMLGENEDFQ